MRKRSGGVTALAIWLIVAGILGGVGAAYYFVIRPRLMEEQIRRQLQDESKATEASQHNTRELLEQFRQHLSEERPVSQTKALLHGLLSIGTLIAGIGILQLKGWARLLAVWQAGVAISLNLWSSYHLLFRFNVSDVTNRFGDPTLQEMARNVAPTLVGVMVVWALIEICWNGFVIGFFMRPGVKAQFVSKMTNR